MSPRGTMMRELKTHLRAAEAELATQRGVSPHLRETLRTTAAELAEHGPLPSGINRRLAAIESTHALRARDMDDTVLDGFFDDVNAATSGERFGRARVTTTYLEAPRSLALWRRTAVAACVLVAVSVTWIVTQDDTPTTTQHVPSQVERYALLDGVLDRYDASGASDGVGSHDGTNSDILRVSGREYLPAASVRRSPRAHATRRGPQFIIRFNSNYSAEANEMLRRQIRRAIQGDKAEIEKN